MKYLVKFFIFSLGLAWFCHSWAAATKTLDSVAAIVNNDIITTAQVNQQMRIVKQHLTEQKQSLPNDVALRKQILNQLIDLQLQLQEAKQKNIQVSNAQVEQTLRNIATQNQISFSQLKQTVQQQGMNFNKYQEQIRDEIMIRTVQQQAIGNIQVTKVDINQFLKSHAASFNSPAYHLQVILIGVPTDATPEQIGNAEQKAQTTLENLNHGADFATTAITESSGPNAMQGGDLGWIKSDGMPPEMIAQLAAAQPDQIIGPVQAPNGFYIVKVLEIRQSTVNLKDKKTRAELEAQVKNYVSQQKYMDAVQHWVKQLRSKAYIKEMV